MCHDVLAHTVVFINHVRVTSLRMNGRGGGGDVDSTTPAAGAPGTPRFLLVLRPPRWAPAFANGDVDCVGADVAKYAFAEA